jgi:uncharacterized protein YkwD
MSGRFDMASHPALPTRATKSSGANLRALISAAAVTLTLFAVFFVAAPTASASLRPRTSLENDIARAVKRLINHERAAHDLAPLKMNDQLRLSARRHNARMAMNDTMSHQLPGEPCLGQRMINAGYYWSYAGENIAWNSDMTESGVLLLERLMYHEQAPNNGHRLNILSKHYRHVGVDVYLDKTHHKIWLTTDFGHRY